MLISIFPKK